MEQQRPEQQPAPPVLTLRARLALRRRLAAAEPMSELYRRLRGAS